MRFVVTVLGLVGGMLCTGDVALAQACIQDQYGRIVCGQPVRPHQEPYAPGPRYYQPPPSPHYGGPPPSPYYGGPPPSPYYGGPPTSPRHGGPQFGGRFYDDDDGRYSRPNRRYRTWNNCPPGYTVQDGLCKPYRGR